MGTERSSAVDMSVSPTVQRHIARVNEVILRRARLVVSLVAVRRCTVLIFTGLPLSLAIPRGQAQRVPVTAELSMGWHGLTHELG